MARPSGRGAELDREQEALMDELIAGGFVQPVSRDSGIYRDDWSAQVAQWRRDTASCTNWAKNDRDRFGNGDQSPITAELPGTPGQALMTIWAGGADFNPLGSPSMRRRTSPFVTACFFGDEAAVQSAIAASASTPALPDGTTASTALLEQRACFLRITPLLACISGARMLGMPGVSSIPAFRLASHAAVLGALIKAGARLDCADVAGMGPLHHCCNRYASVQSLALGELLVRARGGGGTRVDANSYNRAGRAPLIEATMAGRADAVGRLLAWGADPDLKDRAGFCPQRLAATSRWAGGLALFTRARATAEARGGYAAIAAALTVGERGGSSSGAGAGASVCAAGSNVAEEGPAAAAASAGAGVAPPRALGPAPTMAHVRSLGVAGLKALLAAHGVSYAGCVEKAELLLLAEQLCQGEATPHHRAGETPLPEGTGATVAGSGSNSAEEGPTAAATAAAAANLPEESERLPRPARGPAAAACAHCGATAGPGGGRLQRCSGCKAVLYCARACQAAAFPGHKAACRAAAVPRSSAVAAAGSDSS